MTKLSEEIMNYEKKKNYTDSQFAFEVHMSVERIHTLKSDDSNATEEEERKIMDYIRLHK